MNWFKKSPIGITENEKPSNREAFLLGTQLFRGKKIKFYKIRHPFS